ncbi:CLUMA_CG011536, isoform A [Clunio marinus]|uniref:CLUMA_CG011536, isoform A n=1 Tax=Clunio marinus TaxID=568069 RepID=A0A1J1IEH2_9DIPT|nr:CLUMA_CG011536, isoform A [Clunio marinus]
MFVKFYPLFHSLKTKKKFLRVFFIRQSQNQEQEQKLLVTASRGFLSTIKKVKLRKKRLMIEFISENVDFKT